jgi:cyanophycinase
MAYTRVFRELGVREIQVLDIAHRREVGRPSHRALLADAGLVFFTGGDQRRIARRLRDTAIHAALWELHHAGRTIAGTSAGAVALAETMHFSASAAPANDPSAVDTMPGLGLVPDMWIDTHFSRRQRHGRLLAVVAQAPWKIGLGLDEDTAAIMDRRVIRVLGSGSVHVVDGRARGGHDLRIRILRQGDSLDLSDSSA